MFNHLANKENYIFFGEDRFISKASDLTKNGYSNKSEVPTSLWYTFNKIEVYVNGSVEIIGASFLNPNKQTEIIYVGEYTDGSATVEFRGQHKYFHDWVGEPLLQWEGVLNNGDIINYESSRTLRMGYAHLTTGTDFDTYDKAPAVNKWLARSWIDGGEEELFFLVENKQMIDDVAAYYSLPVPYDSALATILTDDLQSIRFKSLMWKTSGVNSEGNWVAVVVASIVFVDNVATKFRLYKTSRE